jgi:hypothetical protein
MTLILFFSSSRFGLKIDEQNIGKLNWIFLLIKLSFSIYRKQKRETTERCKSFNFYYLILLYINSGRREALDKSQRADGESTATGSSTPSAGSSSSLSSVGQEVSTNTEHSLSVSHQLAVCPTISVSTTSNNSNSSRSDLSPGIQSAHSPTYSQQPLALTTTNPRINNNNNNNNNFNHHPRKETFPINHIRQHQSMTMNNNTGPYLKL